MSNNKQQPKPENPNNQFSNIEPLTHAQRVAIANTMSNNKQSSVEFFLYEMFSLLGEFENKALPSYKIMDLFEQAKAMHREEIINAVDGFPIHTRHLLGDDYYNETFNNNEQL